MPALLVLENEQSEQILYVVSYYILHKEFRIGLNGFFNLRLFLWGIGCVYYNIPRLILRIVFYFLPAFLIAYDVDLEARIIQL